MTFRPLVLSLASLTLIAATAEPRQAELIASVDKAAPRLAKNARAIWELAEVGYQEQASSSLLQAELRKAGFVIKRGVAGMPTAFTAEFTQGDGPVIAILAEFDALPGISQSDTPLRVLVPGRSAGHACGHNLFGAASVTAAIAVREWMARNHIQGTLRVYGTPAEEGGSGKVYMVRAGLFDDVSAALHWHPGDSNRVNAGRSQANISGKFRFTGRAAHASRAPWLGRSALDGVEIMNTAANFMREHVPAGTRIHYVITDGGKAPNVVPERAETYYYVRHVDPKVVKDVWARVVKAADGAAMATETSVKHEVTGGVYSMIANETLAQVAQRNLVRVGAPQWTAAERTWAATLAQSLVEPSSLEAAHRVEPIYRDEAGGSTDVSDVSWITPTIGFDTATWVPGTPAHSWQAAAASGTPIGAKGAIVAAKVIALTASDLFANPAVLHAAKVELEKKRGAAFRYVAMVGDRKPPLNYRKASPDEQK